MARLRRLGICLTCARSPIEEFDYEIRCLAIDIKDGIRLARFLALKQQDPEIMNKIKCPAHTKTQMLSNMNVVFRFIDGPVWVNGEPVAPEDLVLGHQEKTLAVLWNLMYKWRPSKIVDLPMLMEETRRLEQAFQSKCDPTMNLEVCMLVALPRFVHFVYRRETRNSQLRFSLNGASSSVCSRAWTWPTLQTLSKMGAW